MTIDEAIELLEKEDRRSYPKRRLEAHLAIKLGTAALARIRYQRLKPTVPHKALLPGEEPEWNAA
jgi:hypothetical protein